MENAVIFAVPFGKRLRRKLLNGEQKEKFIDRMDKEDRKQKVKERSGKDAKRERERRKKRGKEGLFVETDRKELYGGDKDKY